MLDTQVVQFLPGFRLAKFLRSRQFSAQRLFQIRKHSQPSKRRSAIDLETGSFRSFGMVRNFIAAVNLLNHSFKIGTIISFFLYCLIWNKKPTCNHGFCYCHQIVVVGVRHVEFAGGKFGIVRQIDAFVTELATNFVDAINATHNQHL